MCLNAISIYVYRYNFIHSQRPDWTTVVMKRGYETKLLLLVKTGEEIASQNEFLLFVRHLEVLQMVGLVKRTATEAA